ncbi:hypothetical protein [Vibrio sp. NTOU-M3]|uniref:hypothetical protein n=1 Tax=unclassified Vibrio TaxID=2614977 RepID=UPI00349FB987
MFITIDSENIGAYYDSDLKNGYEVIHNHGSYITILTKDGVTDRAVEGYYFMINRSSYIYFPRVRFNIIDGKFVIKKKRTIDFNHPLGGFKTVDYVKYEENQSHLRGGGLSITYDRIEKPIFIDRVASLIN